MEIVEKFYTMIYMMIEVKYTDWDIPLNVCLPHLPAKNYDDDTKSLSNICVYLPTWAHNCNVWQCFEQKLQNSSAKLYSFTRQENKNKKKNSIISSIFVTHIYPNWHRYVYMILHVHYERRNLTKFLILNISILTLSICS